MCGPQTYDYDYLLGGRENYTADRQAADQRLTLAPSTRQLAVNNRRFPRRAVRYAVEREGVRQFLDHGSGLPTEDNVHEVARRADPSARVVHVDNDPVVLAHGRALPADGPSTLVITADLRHTEEIVGHPDVKRLIDFTQPVAALFVSVLHCIPDADLLEVLEPGLVEVSAWHPDPDEATQPTTEWIEFGAMARTL